LLRPFKIGWSAAEAIRTNKAKKDHKWASNWRVSRLRRGQRDVGRDKRIVGHLSGSCLMARCQAPRNHVTRYQTWTWTWIERISISLPIFRGNRNECSQVRKRCELRKRTESAILAVRP